MARGVGGIAKIYYRGIWAPAHFHQALLCLSMSRIKHNEIIIPMNDEKFTSSDNQKNNNAFLSHYFLLTWWCKKWHVGKNDFLSYERVWTDGYIGYEQTGIFFYHRNAIYAFTAESMISIMSKINGKKISYSTECFVVFCISQRYYLKC